MRYAVPESDGHQPPLVILASLYVLFESPLPENTESGKAVVLWSSGLSHILPAVKIQKINYKAIQVVNLSVFCRARTRLEVKQASFSLLAVSARLSFHEINRIIRSARADKATVMANGLYFS